MSGNKQDVGPTGRRGMKRPNRKKRENGEAPAGVGEHVFCVCIQCVRAI